MMAAFTNERVVSVNGAAAAGSNSAFSRSDQADRRAPASLIGFAPTRFRSQASCQSGLAEKFLLLQCFLLAKATPGCRAAAVRYD
jgi:hypothetical protein